MSTAAVWCWVSIAQDGMVSDPIVVLLNKEQEVVIALKRMLVRNLYRDFCALELRVFATREDCFETHQELPDNSSISNYGSNSDKPLVVQIPSLWSGFPLPFRPTSDATREWKRRFDATRLPSHALPSVEELRSFVAAELPVKIPLCSLLISSLPDSIAPETVDKLFTVADPTAPCTNFYDRVVRLALDPIAPSRSQASFIAYWSSLIQSPLTYMMPAAAHCDRDATTPHRPDFIFSVDRVGVFRGEEASTHAMDAPPRDQLRNKLTWMHGDDVPYLLAYATCGYDCALYALVITSTTVVETVEIASFNTEHAEDRLRLLLALLQLTRVFEAIASRCPDTARDEYCDMECPTGVVVRLHPLTVEKIFPATTTGRWSHIGDHLVTVYGVLVQHHVPHVDSLVERHVARNVFVFAPRGTHTRPATLKQLLVALIHVLRALVALHRAQWMHRAIRWDRVVKRRDTGRTDEWFLIDFGDATPSPCVNTTSDLVQRSDNRLDHAPEIFVAGGCHTTAVDLWGVGLLIDTCDLEGQQWHDYGQRTRFLLRLLSSDPAQRPAAADALAELMQLQAAQ